MSRNRKKAVVIGASSGIGRAIAKALGQNGYSVGLAARRVELLRKLQSEIPAPTFIKYIDLTRQEEAMGHLRELINEMGGMDLIVINSGINPHNVHLVWKSEIDTIDVNVAGFVAMANAAVDYFRQQNSGHLVGISSIAGLRGSATSPAYSASKAFVSNYLEGLSHRLRSKNIFVTDIRPGLVDTPMIREKAAQFWVASAEGAAEQIIRAIEKRKRIAYITRRWRLIAWLSRLMPDWLYHFRYSVAQKQDSK